VFVSVCVRERVLDNACSVLNDTRPSRFQRKPLTPRPGDIAFAVQQFYRLTGNTTWLRAVGFPLLQGIAEFWVSRVEPNPSVCVCVCVCMYVCVCVFVWVGGWVGGWGEWGRCAVSFVGCVNDVSHPA
jgi:hypothetical protein